MTGNDRAAGGGETRARDVATTGHWASTRTRAAGGREAGGGEQTGASRRDGPAGASAHRERPGRPARGRTVALSEIHDLLDCEPAAGIDDDLEFAAVVASDAMSEILASSHHGALMLTGLTTIQSVRTAVVADVRTIVYLRGKRPAEKVLQLARDKEIPVMFTRFGMFEACGVLYEAGLEGEI